MGRYCCWRARSSSADRARASVEKTLSRLGAEVDPEHVQVVTDPRALAQATFVVEAVIEDHEVKAGVHAELRGILARGRAAGEHDLLALGTGAGRSERRSGALRGPARLNPVTKMQLVELIFPSEASEQTRGRALALCETFEKSPVEVPDVPGFVVNRLLFPYLFSAVRLLEETGMQAGGDRHLHAASERAT